MGTKPNFVFFFADDQRFDTIAALGNEEISTPNLDELVRRGTTFTHAHIPGGTVNAVCMPSRAMLHTGRSLFHIEEHGKEIPEHHTLLGEHFRKNGYCTFGTGKWHNGTSSYARSFTDGDEIFFGVVGKTGIGMWDHWNVPSNRFDPTGEYKQTENWINNPFANSEPYKVIADHVHLGKHSSELFCDAAIKWLQGYSNAERFLMYVSFMAPHDPRSMPERFLSMYDPDRIRLPDNFAEEHCFEYGMRQCRDEVLAPYPRTPETVRKHLAEYYGMITHLDEEMGRVITELKRTGNYENTIFVFAGDNGLAIGQHGLFGKQNTYEHSVRVPLIMAGPGIPQDVRRDDYVYLFDIFPTLCELAAIPVPSSVDGQSLVAAMAGKPENRRKSLYFAFSHLIRSVKDERYKLIEYRSKEGAQTQLFDLAADPGETRNLYGKEGSESVTESLRGELLRYKEDWHDADHPTGKMFWDRF
jgi:arylsulfatase A-like enzyme